MAIKRFQRGMFGARPTVYACNLCGRKTRNTGDEGGVDLCRQCFDLAGMQNEVSDGYVTRAEHAAEAARLLAEITAKGGKVDAADAWPALFGAELEAAAPVVEAPVVEAPRASSAPVALAASATPAKRTRKARKATHGGKRAGAGRKATDEGERDASLSVRITAAQRAKLESWAAARGLNVSRAIGNMIDALELAPAGKRAKR